MKSIAYAVTALIAQTDAKHLRRLDTNLGMFAEDEPTYDSKHSNDYVKPYHGADLATSLGTQGYAAAEQISGLDFDQLGGQREFGKLNKEPRKKTIVSGLTGEQFDKSYLSHGEDMNIGLGVRFVDEDDIKFNDELSKTIDINFIGGQGYLIAGTTDPAKYAAGFHKTIPGIEEMKGYLSQFATTSSVNLFPDEVPMSSIQTP